MLKVEVLTEGVHSGDASGLVPSSFRIMRQVLDRLEDSASGRPASGRASTARSPPERLAQARATGGDSGRRGLYKRFPWAHYGCGRRPVSSPCRPPPTRSQALLNLHLASHAQRHRRRGPAGSEKRRQRAAALHRLQASACACRRWWMRRMRPRCSLRPCSKTTRPTSAKVTSFRGPGRRLGATGWNAPDTAPWLEQALQRCLAGPFRRALRLHRPGRHDPADEHAAARASRRRR
jgi:hypothetical protein